MIALSEEIKACLAPQERFEHIRQRAVLRKGRSLCDLSYANAYDGPSTQVREAISETLMSAGRLDLQYTPYGGATVARRLIAQSLVQSHGMAFHWRDVVLTPGAMAGLNILFQAVKTGEWMDEVVVVTPCWFDYPLYLNHLHMRPVLVPVETSSHHLDLERIEAALSRRTRAIVLSHPANPTGILYASDELERLAGVLRRAETDVLLISDECHRDVLFTEERFVSPSRFYDATCVIYSFGKRLFMQGQRLGYVAVSPRLQDREDVRQRLEHLCRIMGFCTPTALMQLAVGRLLECKENLSAIRRRRTEWIARLRECGYTLGSSQATFFLYPRTPIHDDVAFVEMLAEQGVLVLPASVFHHAGHFRISVTATDEMLDRAWPVLQSAVEKRPQIAI